MTATTTISFTYKFGFLTLNVDSNHSVVNIVSHISGEKSLANSNRTAMNNF